MMLPSSTYREEAQEGRFEEEGEDAFHGERLPDDAAGTARESRPVGPELELEGDARDDPHSEVGREDASPEAGGPVVVRIGRPKRRRLEDDDDQGEPHRQLREKVVVGGREGEVDAMGSHGVHDLQRQELWNYLKLQGRSSGRSEEHTSELQSLAYLVCRLL